MGGVFFSPKTGAGDLRAAGLCIGYFIACYLSIVIVINRGLVSLIQTTVAR